MFPVMVVRRGVGRGRGCGVRGWGDLKLWGLKRGSEESRSTLGIFPGLGVMFGEGCGLV